MDEVISLPFIQSRRAISTHFNRLNTLAGLKEMLNSSHPQLLPCLDAGKALQPPLWSHASYYSCIVFWD